MKTRAAVAWKAGAPLTIETVDLEGPREGEVLVEVKARGNADFGAPERAIDETKLRCLRNAAFYFTRRWDVPLSSARLDLVTIVFEPFALHHVRDAWGLHHER